MYLRPPGYGEMFAALGYGALVDDARRGRPRQELAAAMPDALVDAVGAIGAPADVAARIAAYHEAGADDVALVPATAEDDAGRALLHGIATDIRPISGRGR